MHRLGFLCSLVLLAACGANPSPAADKPADKPVAARAERPKEELKDRSQTALVTTRETIDGVGFSIDIPAGLKRDANDRDKYLNWTFTEGNPFMEPSITAKIDQAMMVPQDLEALARSATSLKKEELVVAHKEELPGGGLLVAVERNDGQFFKVEALHRAGDKVLRCTVIQRTGTGKPDDKPIPGYPATRAWAEKICSSVKFD